jgi:hypothetical protein
VKAVGPDRRFAAASDPGSGVSAIRRFGDLARALLCALLVLGASGEPSEAARYGEPPQIFAEFGFGGHMLTERWSPVTVWVSSDGLFEGFIEVQHAQDLTQTARILVPFSATPGRSIPVDLAVAMPVGADRIDLNLLDRRGRSVRRLRYSSGSGELRLPIIKSPMAGLFVSVGPVSLPDAVRHWRDAAAIEPGPRVGPERRTARDRRDPGPRLADDPMEGLFSAPLLPDRLPGSWAAYDAVSVLAVKGETAAAVDPRALREVHRWVESGGRLVIDASNAGDEWRLWFPQDVDHWGQTPLPVELSEVRQGALPDGLVGGAGRTVSGEEGELSPGAGAAVVEVAESMPLREVSLTDLGRRAAWRVRWLVGEEAGLVAEGPVGLGLVTVIGFEPRRVGRTVSAGATAAVWGELLEADLARWREAATMPAGWYGSPMPLDQYAQDAVIEHLADVPTVGGGVFWMFVAGMALLGILLGPFDAVVLKRMRLSHRSWLTALAWIGLASAVAMVGPGYLRSGDTTVNRVATIDAVLDGQGWATAAWRSGRTGVFAERSGTMRIHDASVGPERPGSWWRGVSQAGYFGQQAAVGSPLTTVQAGSNAPEPLPVGIWTFRTFADHGPASLPFTASVRGSGEDLEIRLGGLPPGAHVQRANLRTADGWMVLSVEASEGSVLLRPAGRGASDWEPPADTRGTNIYWPGRAGHTFAPWSASALRGPDRRTAAIDGYVSSGRWVALHAVVKGLEPDVRIDWDSVHRQDTVVRILLPLEEP